jgi:hypothetical protein
MLLLVQLLQQITCPKQLYTRLQQRLWSRLRFSRTRDFNGDVVTFSSSNSISRFFSPEPSPRHIPHFTLSPEHVILVGQVRLLRTVINK